MRINNKLKYFPKMFDSEIGEVSISIDSFLGNSSVGFDKRSFVTEYVQLSRIYVIWNAKIQL